MAKNKMQLMAEQNDDRKLAGFSAELYEWLEAIAFAIAIVVLVFTFVFRIITVDGVSMEPTFQDQNRVLVNRMMGEPEENDIVIIIMPSEVYDKPIIKRVVATEGQWLQITDGVLCVGDTPDTLVQRQIPGLESITLTGDLTDWSQPIQVPEDCVFVMGDNRNNSLDSRDTRIGFVNKEYLLGKVILRIYPFSEFGTIDTAA